MGETTCRVFSAGLVPYEIALAWQEGLLRGVGAGGRDCLLLLEHPHVLTIGRGGHEENILAGRESLAGRGVAIHEVSRGGDVTYHGPGQLVGYPIFNLDRHGRDLHLFLRNLEQVGLEVLDRFGLCGRRDRRYTGVWVGGEKVMAIGVAVRKWVSYHGFALNMEPDLEYFHLINPCGIKDKGVTSLARLLGRPVRREEVEPVVIEAMARVFGLKMRAEPISNLHIYREVRDV